MTAYRLNKAFQIAGVTVAASLAFAPQLPAQSPGCNLVKLDKQPLWISSTSWIDNLAQIAVVDPLKNSVFLISKDGKVSTVDEKKLAGATGEMVPAVIERVGNKYLLQMVDQRLLWLDAKLNFEKTDDLAKIKINGNNTIVSTYDWIATNRFLLAVGAVKTETGHRFGFFKASIPNFSSLNFLLDTSNIDYYLLGYRYLAEINDHEAYFVRMNDKASIYKVSADHSQATELEVFPEGKEDKDKYRQIPPIPTISTGVSSDELLYKSIETLTIPVGLYGQDGLLYLLTREPRLEGGTLWLLHQINPATQKVLGQIVLPTTANHITVLPTGKSWFVFEKGPVTSGSQQKIASMLVIPTQQIRNRSVQSSCQKN